MKRNSPAYPTVAMCIVGAASSMLSLQSGAFQLGQIQGASRVDEPFSAYINVMMSPRESQLETAIKVLPDFTYRYDAVMNDALNAITATMVRNEYGQHYIALSSSRKLNLALLSFRLQAKNGESVLIQNYSLAPRPPLPVVIQQPQATLSPRRLASNAAVTASQHQALPSALTTDGEYGPVQAGDTLWKIATKVAGRDAGKILNQIFALNPNAFINGDINKLKQGVVLVLPATESQTAIAVADTPLLNESSAVDTTEELILSVEEPTTVVEESTVIDDIAFGIEESVTGNLVDTDISTSSGAGEVALALTTTESKSWRGENPELAEKLDSLGDKYAALRARYLEQSAASSVAVISDASVPSATLPVVAVNDTSKVLTGRRLQEAEFAGLATEENMAALSAADLAPSISESSLESPGKLAEAPRFELPSWLLVLLGLSLVMSALGYLLYRSRQASQRQAAQIVRTENDQSLKQELAKKAQHRITMEDEVERMLGERLEDDGDETEKTMQMHVDDVLPEQFITLPPVDDSAQSRIDASISHGRYAEAEDLLREVIVESPRNFTAKLRLAEVYYITEKISDFVEISQDIHAHHRPDISDDDWRRVMRMGKMIAPDQPPFSGPQPIVGDASAG